MNDKSITSLINVVPWWYTQVPNEIAKQQRLFISTVADYFSFGILLKTLFQPWKRDITPTEGLSLQQKFQVWSFNQVAKLIGAVVRLGAILVGFIVLIVIISLFVIIWLGWLLAPIIALFLIGYGILLLFKGLKQ